MDTESIKARVAVLERVGEASFWLSFLFSALCASSPLTLRYSPFIEIGLSLAFLLISIIAWHRASRVQADHE